MKKYISDLTNKPIYFGTGLNPRSLFWVLSGQWFLEIAYWFRKYNPFYSEGYLTIHGKYYYGKKFMPKYVMRDRNKKTWANFIKSKVYDIKLFLYHTFINHPLRKIHVFFLKRKYEKNALKKN